MWFIIADAPFPACSRLSHASDKGHSLRQTVKRRATVSFVSFLSGEFPFARPFGDAKRSRF
jgi:hypothetical protein